jgi:hypothetical protein
MSNEGERKKIKILKEVLKECLDHSKTYKSKYKKLKKFDDRLDVLSSFLSGGSIVLVLVGFEFPPCLVASAVLGSIDFVIKRGQDKYNYKQKYTQHHLTMLQYKDLAREIRAVLSKNHMTSEEYQNYIEECNDKLSLIQDTQLF